MLYTDGMTAILIFSGVYAAGVMHWRTLDLLALGIMMSFAAAIGGLLAARLDRAFGPKRAIMLEIATVIVCEVLILGLAPDRLFYLPYVSPGPVWGGPVFRTLPELMFLGLGMINAPGRLRLLRLQPRAPDQADDAGAGGLLLRGSTAFRGTSRFGWGRCSSPCSPRR